MRKLECTLHTVLDLVACADQYGFADDVLFSAFGDIAGNVTDAEIAEYGETFLTPESRAQGYSEEDQEEAVEKLTEWRNKYASGKSDGK